MKAFLLSMYMLYIMIEFMHKLFKVPPQSVQNQEHLLQACYGVDALATLLKKLQLQTRKSCTGRSPVRSIGIRA